MRVICDSNVWYGFVDGKFENTLMTRFNLCTPIKVLEEITTSENLLINPIYVKRVLSLVLKTPNQIILENPYDYIVRLVNNNHFPNNEHSEFIVNQAIKFISLDDNYINSKVGDPKFKELVKQWDSELEKSTQFINELLPKIRRNIKNDKGKNFHRNLQTEQLIRELIIHFHDLTIERFQINDKFDWAKFPWDKIQLLVTTWDTYFKDLELSGTMKFHKNDWIDLINLFYVQPGMMYWTNELKWIKIFERNEKLKNYVFKPN